MRPVLSLCLILTTLAACSPPPAILWPTGPVPATPALLPQGQLAPPPASADPGPALTARAAALRASLGL